jgi:thiol-disulfide isomerase/thioredoxin
MSVGTSGALAAATPDLPSVVHAAMRQAAEARRDGRLDLATSALESALAQLREEPYGAPFLARVQLGLALADAYLDTDDRERARRLLLDESGYAERIFHLTRLSGSPEQVRAASAGRMQVRDRAAQVELLGQPAPEIDVADWVLGEPASLADLQGKVVLLEFWATWCRPCLEMMPKLRDLHERYAARGLEILALTRYGQTPAGTDPAEAQATERRLVRTVVDGRGLAFRVGIAPDARLQRRYGAMGVPTLALIDRGGTVRLITSGGDEAALELATEGCLAELRSVG